MRNLSLRTRTSGPGASPLPRGTTQVERRQREIDRRHPRRWGPLRKFEGWSTKGGVALARQMAEKPKPEHIVRMVEAPSPHHASQFAADIIEPSYSELIHDRRVLDLLPVIEDQTADPFWDEPLEFMPFVVHERRT